MGKIVTADNIRDQAGKATVIKASPHEGVLRRPVEVGLDNFSPKTPKTPEDFFREKAEREAAAKGPAPTSESEKS